MVVLLVAGIAAFTAGVAVLGYGISLIAFSLGSTLMTVGAIGVSTGLLLLGLWLVCRELRALARRLDGNELPLLPRKAAAPVAASETSLPPVVIGDLTAPPAPASEPVPPSWTEPEPEPEPAPPPKPRRNLLFSSSSRRERERAAAKASEQPADEPPILPPSPEPVSDVAPEPEPELDPRASFDAAWPQAERIRPESPRRRDGAAAETKPFEPPAPRRPDPKPVTSEVTVLKSGVVDGMAYSLYSDGSIEAQMPEGMVRFASIDELRAHLDQRA